jgi:hypothetical protein
MVSSGMLRRVALVRTDASFIRVTGIGELGTTLAITSNQTHAAKKYQVYKSVSMFDLSFGAVYCWDSTHDAVNTRLTGNVFSCPHAYKTE